MTQIETIPFTYLIGWSTRNIYYYGVRYAAGTGPDTLWKTYFTSSKPVKAFRSLFGEPDIVQVRKVFESKDKAKTWELRVLTRLGVPGNKKFLNKTRSLKPDSSPKGGIKNGFFGKRHTPETLAKMKASHNHEPRFLGKKHTDETKAKISKASSEYRATDETKAKIGRASKGRQTFLGKKHSEEAKQKISNRVITPETIEKMRIAQKKRRERENQSK